MSEYVVDVGQRHIREVNEEIQEACKRGDKIRVVNTLSRHNLGVGLPPGADLYFEGSVGYYCGGLNTGARVEVERNAGWAVGEGMSDGHDLHPLQQQFIDNAALQCGICTPGFLVAAKSLLDHNPDPSIEEIRYALAGNLCRCTGYDKIVRAVQAAAKDLQKQNKK